jgi:hypothetical protein
MREWSGLDGSRPGANTRPPIQIPGGRNILPSAGSVAYRIPIAETGLDGSKKSERNRDR